jgi:hypothetical protein
MKSLVLSLCLVLSAQSANGKYKSLGVQLGDLPKGFVVAYSFPLNNAALRKIHSKVHSTERVGITGGYAASYNNKDYRSLTPGPGINNVTSEILAFKSAAYGQELTNYYRRGLPHACTLGACWKLLPNPHLGTNSVVASWSPHRAQTFIQVTFNRGKIYVLLLVGGKYGTFSAAQAIGLARTIDSRIKASR